MTYEHFLETLDNRVKTDDIFYYELLATVITHPYRYTGIFRLSNAKTKLIQNVTQSREIKFGDFMEEIVTEYIASMGYTNMNKDIGNAPDGNSLSADQVFCKGNTLYLIEQKIRDDHDSTKKRGQYENFRKKYLLLKRQNRNCRIVAIMWFIDSSLVKNRRYYEAEARAERTAGIDIHILYGGDLFDSIFSRLDVWNEMCHYLLRNKQERSNEILNIPDFDTSEEMLIALRKLKRNEPSLYGKLVSNSPAFIQVRKELFPTGKNLSLI